MNRFVVLYLHQDVYYPIACQTQREAYACLEKIFRLEGSTPVGVYDAKTELLHWETTRQHPYDQLSVEEQGRLGHQLIAIAQGFFTQATPSMPSSFSPNQE
jgi:hypothetical protein